MIAHACHCVYTEDWGFDVLVSSYIIAHPNATAPAWIAIKVDKMRHSL